MEVAWIIVNGARVDREFFEMSVRDAKQLQWKPMKSTDLDAHQHCIVCGKALSPHETVRIYNSGDRYIDDFCFQRFVVQ